MQAQKLSQRESACESLVARLNDNDFIMQFAQDPYLALEDSGINLTLAEFTEELSNNKAFYDLVIKKISDKVDVSKINVAASSCCSTPTTN
jgi:hypothetical protein